MNVLLLFLFLQEFVKIARTPYTIRKRKINQGVGLLKLKPGELTKYVKKAILIADSCCPQAVCAVLEEMWEEVDSELADQITVGQVEKEILNYEKEGQ